MATIMFSTSKGLATNRKQRLIKQIRYACLILNEMNVALVAVSFICLAKALIVLPLPAPQQNETLIPSLYLSVTMSEYVEYMYLQVRKYMYNNVALTCA